MSSCLPASAGWRITWSGPALRPSRSLTSAWLPPLMASGRASTGASSSTQGAAPPPCWPSTPATPLNRSTTHCRQFTSHMPAEHTCSTIELRPDVRLHMLVHIDHHTSQPPWWVKRTTAVKKCCFCMGTPACYLLHGEVSCAQSAVMGSRLLHAQRKSAACMLCRTVLHHAVQL